MNTGIVDGRLTISLSKDEVKILLYTLLGEPPIHRSKAEELIETLTDALEDFR